MNLDSNARYATTHEWARPDGDTYTVGITDHAQDELSDVVYVELPEVGATMQKGDIFGVVESVKAASDLYMPVGGEIVEINERLIDEPELVNDAPFGDGWMIKIGGAEQSEWEELMDGKGYEKAVEEN